MFEHSSETPVAISTKLGTHMAVCMFKHLMHIYIYIIYPKHLPSCGMTIIAIVTQGLIVIDLDKDAWKKC
jgi:hypothetical protein